MDIPSMRLLVTVAHALLVVMRKIEDTHRASLDKSILDVEAALEPWKGKIVEDTITISGPIHIVVPETMINFVNIEDANGNKLDIGKWSSIGEVNFALVIPNCTYEVPAVTRG